MKKIITTLTFSTLLLMSCSKSDSSDSDEYEGLTLLDLNERIYAGGATTIFSENSLAYSVAAPNLTEAEDDKHTIGDRAFETTFVTNPAPIYGGLGPIFNSNSCISCHPGDGRAAFPTDLERSRGFFMRVSLPSTDAHGGPLPVPGFGTQVQNRSLTGFQPEGKYAVSFTDSIVTFRDGSKVTLKVPHYTLNGVNATVPPNILISPRTSMPIYGLGLLENIPEADLKALEDVNDANNDGISGKINYVWDGVHKKRMVGRFGWKANTATLLDEAAGSFSGDLGVTNPYYPVEIGKGQAHSDDGKNDDPEMSKEMVDATEFYLQTLAVPAMRNAHKKSVRYGAYIFEGIGCAKCHTVKQRTLNAPTPALANQTFYPYTDMLLHDMGPALADNRPDFLANGREWRTRPLWGIGLQEIASGHTNFLHDGRAKNITEAILWHGGESEKSKKIFLKLTKKEREDLLEFLNSI